jgi:putative membrane protein
MKEILNAMIYTVLTIMLALLILQDKLKNFLHPKMFGYVIFLVVGLLILAIYSWYTIYTSRKTLDMTNCHSLWPYMPFFFMILLIMLNPSNLSAQVIENKMISTVKSEIKSEIPVMEFEVIDNKPKEGLSTQELNYMLSESEDNFIAWIERVSENPHAYVGERIVVNGFVYKEEGFEDNNLVVARLLVNCCVADSMLVGFFVQTEEALSYQKDTWVQVEGIVGFEDVYFEHLEGYQETYIIKEGIIREIIPYSQPYVYMN